MHGAGSRGIRCEGMQKGAANEKSEGYPPSEWATLKWVQRTGES